VYVKIVGYPYTVAIFLQVLTQLAFLAYYDKRLRSRNMTSVAWPVWLVFAMYGALNVRSSQLNFIYLSIVFSFNRF